MFDDVKSQSEVSLYPSSQENHRDEIDYARKAFVAAQVARQQNEDKWLRDYRMYRLHVDKNRNDWRSKAYIPMIFHAIQSILPKVIAQLPQPVVEGVTQQDEEAAKRMEGAMLWASKETKLQLRIFEQFWSALLYGTGILKVRVGKETITRHERIPIMQDLMIPGQTPVMDPETGMPLMGPNGPVMEDHQTSMGQIPTGRTRHEATEETVYLGPVADYVDLFNFYPAPEASDSVDARYIVHREWMPREWVQKRVKEGIYKLPEGFADSDYWQSDADNPKFKRLSRIGYGGSRSDDQTTNMCQMWDVWRRDEGTVTTILNERYIVAKKYTPYQHGMQPFVRAVDYLIPGEMWGQGEAEILENLQDLENTVWNARMDELKMKLAKMFMVDEQALVDPREITRLRPGGFVRVSNPNGLPIQNIIAPIELGEVLTTAYTEAGEIERMIEKISATTPYATGSGEVNPSDTATSTAIFSDSANSRLGMKVRVAELGGFNDLMKMYGSVLQQFTPPDMLMRIEGETGPEFQQVGEDVTGGGFRFQIQAASSSQTETIRKDQDMSLLQTASTLVDPATGQLIANITQLWKDTLKDFGKKDVDRYVNTPAPPPPPPGAPDQGGGLPPDLAALMGGGAPQEGPPPEAPPDQMMAMGGMPQ